jgi:transcriptional regulator with XRE-family HTH domain
MEHEARARRRANEVGSSGRRAAANLEAIREDRRLSQDELAEAVERLGRPMTRQIVGKTEAGDRRIDVDDLVAFAVALGVTPNRLLMPDSAGQVQAELLPELTVSELDEWKCASGEEQLPADNAEPGVAGRFLRENRPHAVPDGYFGGMHLHRDLLEAVIGVANLARKYGIPLAEIKFNLDAAYVHAVPDDEPGGEEG